MKMQKHWYLGFLSLVGFVQVTDAVGGVQRCRALE